MALNFHGLTKGIRDKFKSVIIVIDFVVEVSEVETIGDVVLVYFTEILVPFAAEEPGNP